MSAGPEIDLHIFSRGLQWAIDQTENFSLDSHMDGQF